MVAANLLCCLEGEEPVADDGLPGGGNALGGVARRLLLALLLDGEAAIGGNHALARLAPLQGRTLGRHVAPDALAHPGYAQVLQGLLLGDLLLSCLGLGAHSSQSESFKACCSMASAVGGSKALHWR